MPDSKHRSLLLETRLAARECQLELVAQTAEIGFWSFEPSTSELSWSPRCQSLLDVVADAATDFDALISRILPADQASVRRAFSQALQFKREFTVEFSVPTERDTQRRLRCTGRPHASAIARQQLALSGVIQTVEDAGAMTAASAQRMSSIVQRIESQREMERNTLVDRIKTEVSQRFADVSLELHLLSNREELSPELKQALTTLADTAGSSMEAVRSAIYELCPPGVEELGFTGALERFATERAATAGLSLSLSLPQEPVPVDTIALAALYATACNAIDNVVHHARARHMSVAVQYVPSKLSLRIVDDGIGIAGADLMKEGSLGLFTSLERLAHCGGELRVSGESGQGTVLEASIALPRKSSAAKSDRASPRVA